MTNGPSLSTGGRRLIIKVIAGSSAGLFGATQTMPAPRR
jgi:hypothetical protein